RPEWAPPRRLMSLLFAAAWGGGAYGRVAAWESLTGLVGAGAGKHVGAVAASAQRCTWLYFEAASAWFYQVAWDFGVLAGRSDGESVAVLAAPHTHLPPPPPPHGPPPPPPPPHPP